MPGHRARSTMSARPSGSQFGASQLGGSQLSRPEAGGLLIRQLKNGPPAHEPPTTKPMSAIHRRKLGLVASSFRRRLQAERHAAAIKLLAECAHDLGENLQMFENKVEKAKKKAERGDEDANSEDWQAKFHLYKAKHDATSKKLEKYARTCVDLGERASILVNATEAIGEIPAATQQGRSTRRGGTQGGMSSFEPTLPGATERDDDDEDAEGDTTMNEENGEPVESVLDTFKETRKAALASWTSKSLYDRYANNTAYADFKAMEFEGYHGDEAEVPAAEKWFQTEEPAPGTVTQGAADDSDDDIQVARTTISTKCPLTLQEFKDPVMSTLCKHTFEKEAIHEMLGRRPQVQCPVGGCPHHITRSQLAPNDKLLRKIRRIQQARAQRREELDDEDAPRGTNADTSILLSDGPDAGGFQSLDAVRMKQEKASQGQQRRRHEDEDDDEDVTEEESD